MKILQAVAASPVENPDDRGSGLIFCSKDMPEAIRNETAHPDAAAPSLRSVEADGARWLVVNRIVPTGEGHMSHTLAFREDRLAYSQLGSLLEEMKLDFAEKAQENSGDAKKQVEAIVSELRREVTALQNRVDEYANAKWWHFDGEEEIKRRRRDINQLERTAKGASDDLMKDYRAKASSVLRILPDAKVSGKDGVAGEPGCFPELMAKFEKLAGDYRELSRIVAICDRTNLAEASVNELQAANAQFDEQLSVAKRELEVSKLSDKIMSSKMKTYRKEEARAKAGKSASMSWQTAALIFLSLAVAGLTAVLFLKGLNDGEPTGDAAAEKAAAELQKLEWDKERDGLSSEIRKFQSKTAALEAKIKTLEPGE